ncbi:MAG: urea ABC transporter permease subunit UrtB [Hyphomicrobiales bacterium]|nr:urea ABC transporter permease subunit UrtB [Hyphomicrobiales bacterium]MDE2114652.1 urea ABC transporter permease subunit UrtB [Hyphomicrobiales bacterium]
MHWLRLLALWVAIAILPQNAFAEGPDTALARFAQHNFMESAKAVRELASDQWSGAGAVLAALSDNRLYYDAASKVIYFKDEKGTLHTARDGLPAAGIDVATLSPVHLNNAVRSALEDAKGSMTMVSADPVQRLSGAKDAFRAHDPAALPAITAELAKETDPEVKLALQQAQAAIIAASVDAPIAQRLDAIKVVQARGDDLALSVLSAIGNNAQGEVKTAALAATANLQATAAIWANVQNVYYGLSLGSVLLLAAIGLAITFGVMGVINMAHGEMVMLGAYTTYIVQQWLRAYRPEWFDASLFIAIPLAFLVTGFIGVIIERTIIRFLYGRPLETLLATFGLSLVLQQAVRTIFGADNRNVGAPHFMSGIFHLGGLSVTYGRMWIILFSILVFLGLQMLLRATSFGLKMRAVTQNRRMASAMGIDTNKIDALAFGLGSGIAGIAGVALSQLDNVSPNLGQSYIIDSFMVVVFGGVGNLWGTLVAAMSLGVANKILEPFVGAVLGKILILICIILFIQRRPRGLFALKGRAVES